MLGIFRVASAAVLACAAAPAWAADDAVLPYEQLAAAPTEAPRYDFAPGARDAWLSDCRRRVALRDATVRSGTATRAGGSQGIDACESYLDSYLASYRQAAASGLLYTYAVSPGHAFADPLQLQPAVMLVPVAQPVSTPVPHIADGVEYANDGEKHVIHTARRTIPRRSNTAPEECVILEPGG